MRGLRPCTACRRHVRNGEATCPFCGAAFVSGPPLPALRGGRRIARATLTAVTMSTSPLMVAACTTSAVVASDAYGAPPDAAPGPQDADVGFLAGDAYGAPPVDAQEDAQGAGIDAMPDTGFPSDAYGVPADVGGDGGPDVGSVVGDAYGAPADAMEDVGFPSDAYGVPADAMGPDAELPDA